jgi:hypothetical protein
VAFGVASIRNYFRLHQRLEADKIERHLTIEAVEVPVFAFAHQEYAVLLAAPFIPVELWSGSFFIGDGSDSKQRAAQRRERAALLADRLQPGAHRSGIDHEQG